MFTKCTFQQWEVKNTYWQDLNCQVSRLQIGKDKVLEGLEAAPQQLTAGATGALQVNAHAQQLSNGAQVGHAQHHY
jgi:hypothetical protein